jgi:HlyD family secretion protein
MVTAALQTSSQGPRRWSFPWRRVGVAALKLFPVLALALVVARQRLLVPIPVRTATVERGDVVREVFGRGTLESRREVQLGFDLVGRISDVLVDEGDHVELGQVLAHLAPEQFRAEVHTASSGVSLARAAIQRLDAEERRAAATLRFAEGEEQRSQGLVSAGALSGRDRDLAVQQLALARAELDRVRAARDEARRQVAVASGTAEARGITAARAVVVAPFEGLIIRRLRDPGDTVTIGTTVLRIVATDALWSRAWLDESALPHLREQQPARVRLGAIGDGQLVGRVDRIGRQSDRQTHELLVDILLEAPPARIAIGQRADVWVELERRKDVLRVPTGFIHDEGKGPFCYVDRGGRIARVPVVLGLRGVDVAEVSSLNEGDVLLDPVDPGATLGVGRRWERDRP